MKGPFPVDAVLTGIVLAYTNPAAIADRIMPRVGVGGMTFKWLEFGMAQFATVPNTLVGRKGVPNEVEFGATEQSGFTLDYGLDDVVPNDDIANAPAGWDPLGNAAQGIADLIILDREIRVAKLVQDTANYTKVEAVTAGEYWDDPASDPVTQIMDHLASCLVRPNVGVFSRKQLDRLLAHPKVVAAVHANGGNAATGGRVSRQALAALLEIERIEVGEARVNTARPGQAANLQRAWNDSAASFLLVNPLANTRSAQMTWGYTAQYGSRIASRFDEPKTGLRGAIRVRAGESVNELVVAKDAGVIFTTPLTP